MEIIVTITCLFMLLITAITTSFTIAMAIIIRDKLKIKMELKQAIADKEKFCTEIYEDIDSNRAASSLVDTDSNIAYSHTTQQH